MPIYIQHLKDEPRALEKIVDGNTRIFGGAPADWSFRDAQIFALICSCSSE